MIPFRKDIVDDIPVVEFMPYGLSGNTEFDDVSDALHDVLVRSEAKRLVLDLSRVQLISSAALGVLMALHQTVAAHGGQLALCGIQNRVHQVFKFSGLDRLFVFCETRDGAVRLAHEGAGA